MVYETQKPYLLNQSDAIPPLRYKKTRNEPRANRRFTDQTKQEKFEIAGGKCELCNKQLPFELATFHHVVSLSYAFHYFPHLTDEILKSIANCQMLCQQCHEYIHKQDSLEYYTILVTNLLLCFNSLDSPEIHSLSSQPQ